MRAYKLPSGQWTCLASWVDGSGARHRKRFTADKKKDAEALASEHSRVNSNTIKQDDQTLTDAAARYIREREAVLSPQTIVGYKSIARYAFDDYSMTWLSDFRQSDVQEAVNRWAENHSPKTVRNIYGLFKSVMSEYRPDFQVKAKLPQKVKPQLNTPSEDDMQRVFDAIRGTRYEVPVMIAAIGGLRRSEICALTLDDIGDGTISVNKAMVLTESKQWVIKTTKTITGTRIASVPKQLTDRIREVGLTDINPDALTNAYGKLLKRIGVPHHRFHDLRAYFASALHYLGVPDQYIMSLGGWHDSHTMQSHYRRNLSKKDAEISERIDAYFEHFL